MRTRLHGVREMLDSGFMTLFALFFLIQPFVAQAYEIPSGSMENSLPIGTRILASPLATKVVPVKDGDALVFYPPHQALEMAGQKEGEVWIKRCIGTPGQLIEIKMPHRFHIGSNLLFGAQCTAWLAMLLSLGGKGRSGTHYRDNRENGGKNNCFHRS